MKSMAMAISEVLEHRLNQLQDYQDYPDARYGYRVRGEMFDPVKAAYPYCTFYLDVPRYTL